MGEPIRVVHIDADPTFCATTKSHLEDADGTFDVESFNTPSEAIERLQQSDVDCVVTEQSLSSAGDGSTGAIAESDRHAIPVIILTDGDGQSNGNLPSHADGYLRKDDSALFERLIDMIERAVNAHQETVETTRYVDHLESLVDNLPGIAYRSDTKHPWPMLSIHGDSVGLMGYETSTIINGSVSYGDDVIHPADREHVTNKVNDSLESDGEFEVRYRIQTADGSIRWVYDSGRLVDPPDMPEPVLEGFITDITGWHHHRERQRVLFEDAADAIVEVNFEDDTAIIDRVNPAFESVFGVSAFEAVDRPVNEVIVPPAGRSHAAEIDRRVMSGEIVEEELRRATADGQRWFLLRTVPFTLGTEQRAYATYVDITDQKEREHAIESLHVTTRSMFDQTDESAIYETAVQAVSEVLGYEDVVGVTIGHSRERLVPLAVSANLDTPGDRPGPVTDEEHLLWDTIDAAEPTTVPSEALRGVFGDDLAESAVGLAIPVGADGLILAKLPDESQIDAPQRRLAGLLGSATATAIEDAHRDAQLTDLHSAASAIGATETRDAAFEQLITAAEEILEFDFAVVDAREGDHLITKATSSAIDDASYFERTPIDATDNLAASVYRSGEPDLTDDLTTLDVVPADPTFRSALTVPIGTEGLFQAAAKREAAFDETDLEFVELLITHVDEALTRLERTRELEERTTELNRQNERLEQFAELVSHDLRNPLSIIEGRLELARRDVSSEHLDAIDGAIDRMESIIDDTLTLAREGRTVGETEPIDLEDIATRCWTRVETDDTTLEVEGELRFAGDPDRVKHVLENLFRNAIEHGDATTTIRVGSLDTGGFFVSDDGPGIPPDERSSVFEPGYSTGDDGIGLGLAIVLDIVEAHGWSIEATESEAGGARFEITDVVTVE